MYTDETLKQEADAFISSKTTFEDVANALDMGRSTLHVHLTKYLCYADPQRYSKVREIVDRNIAIRNSRFCRR